MLYDAISYKEKNLEESNKKKIEGGLRVRGLYKKSYTNKPLISIITVVYNANQYIENVIKSVINQTYTNIEYIIIDGGSTDGTLDVIKKYDNFIDYWVSEPDKGISNAFNKGISLSNGEIIGIINADDWYEPDATSTIIDTFKQDSGVEIVCGLVQYWEGDKKIYIRSSNPDGLYNQMTINQPSVFVKNNVYKSFGLFNEEYRYAMDYELLLRFKVKGVKFKSIEKVIANMRLGGASDKNWQKALYEVRTAKNANLKSNRLSIFIWYYWQLVKGNMSHILKMLGLEKINEIYRIKKGKIKNRYC